MKHYNIPVFIPHLGCPHTCIFCNQNKITGQTAPVTPAEAEREIERYLSFLPPDPARIEIAFFGGSFTAIDPLLQQDLLALAQRYVASGKVGGIRLSTRPDAVEKDALDRLRRFGVTTVELGVQSFCDEVLSASERGHSAACAIDACKRVRQYGFSLGVQLMCGLPEDTPSRALFSAKVAKIADFVRIYPVLVLKGTPLEALMQSGRYRPLTTEEAVALTAQMAEALDPVPVIRAGLYTEDRSIVAAGPFHPAFGELVASYRCDLHLRRAMEDRVTEGKTLMIRAPKREFSKLAGQNRRNLTEWKRRYGFAAIEFHESDRLSFSLTPDPD